MKILLRTLLGLILWVLVFGVFPAHAIFGIRAARTAIAARRAQKAVSSPKTEPTAPETATGKLARQEKQDLEDDIP
ncbi:MAG TPA: hypothetical protein PLL75_01275 [Candidatus Omnitrophota bacterium]|nr:hypothetical protein [Candidatus Omnitrophota bacterium]HPS36345.1 hypothetical protein [Candidatus Omnitrophota bacterium]